MATTVNGLRIRRVLGRREWQAPRPYGADGWYLTHVNRDASVIVSADVVDGDLWIHASMTRADRVPTYEELTRLHEAVFGDGWAYQVFAPPSEHVNIHEFALHLWGRADGKPALPNFGELGTI